MFRSVRPWVAHQGWIETIRRRARNALPLAVCDILLIVVAWVAALLLRYDADVPAGAWDDLAGFLPVVLATTMVFHGAAGLYSGVLRFASVMEARQILIAQMASLLVLLPAVWLLDRPVPLSTPIIAAVLCCCTAGATRFWSRLLRWRQLTDGDVERIVVIGAGEAGGALVRDIQQQRAARIVAFVDDDNRQWGLRIHGVRVGGPCPNSALWWRSRGPREQCLRSQRLVPIWSGAWPTSAASSASGSVSCHHRRRCSVAGCRSRTSGISRSPISWGARRSRQISRRSAHSCADAVF